MKTLKDLAATMSAKELAMAEVEAKKLQAKLRAIQAKKEPHWSQRYMACNPDVSLDPVSPYSNEEHFKEVWKNNTVVKRAARLMREQADAKRHRHRKLSYMRYLKDYRKRLQVLVFKDGVTIVVQQRRNNHD